MTVRAVTYSLWSVGFFLAAAVLVSSEASAESFGRRRVLGNGLGRASVQVVNRNQLKEIPGFSRLQQLGNQLVEVNNQGQVRRLFIDPRTGRLIGASQRDTVEQLKEFFTTNLDNFRGNNLDVVRRFLFANGLGNAIFGQLNVDTKNYLNFSDDSNNPELKNANPVALQTAALNMLINSISTSRRLARVNPANVAGGQVNLNLNGILRGDALALLTNNNPYACSGTGREPARLDFLIARAMDPDIYYQLIGASRTLDGLGQQLGVFTDKRQTSGNKILIASLGQERESGVGVNPQRVLEGQPMANNPGGFFYRSFDFIANPPPGAQSTSRDVLAEGINFTQDADEFIFDLPNGMRAYYLANAAGARARAAPADIALGGPFPDVTSPAACMHCHANGLLGGGQRFNDKSKVYTDHLARIPGHSRNFFTSNRNYRAIADQNDARYKQRLRDTNSCLPDSKGECQAVVPAVLKAYNSDLTVAAAAAELGTTEANLRRIVGGSQDKIPRKRFEQAFCGLKAQLGSSALAGNFQNPIRGNAAGAVRAGVQPPPQASRPPVAQPQASEAFRASADHSLDTPSADTFSRPVAQ